MKVEVVILAAGKGSRMKSKLPKVLHKLAGKALSEHVLDTIEGLGPVHMVVGHEADQVRAHFAHRQVNFVEQLEQLGTGHAVAQALPYIQDDTIVLIGYGDVPGVRRETYEGLVAIAEHGDVGLLTIRIKDPTGYGRIVRDDRGNVVGIVEQKEATIEELAIDEINTGLMAVAVKHLRRWLPKLSSSNSKGEYYLTDIIAMASGEGVKVTAMMGRDADEVAGINSKDQLATMERAWQFKEAQKLMRNGATLADPARVDVRGTLKIGMDVFIDVNTVFEGLCVLGNDVHIGPGVVLKNAVVGDGVSIHAHSVVEGCTIAAQASIGPFARIRPNSVIGERAKIGNFVEIKNSVIASGVAASHLAYLGDAEVGADANIGAGTVTCNYDGAQKHKTVIGVQAFVGSNTTLVAPLEVGAHAFIGAGSTVTDHAPAGQLTVARSKAVTVENWQPPTLRTSAE